MPGHDDRDQSQPDCRAPVDDPHVFAGRARRPSFGCCRAALPSRAAKGPTVGNSRAAQRAAPAAMPFYPVVGIVVPSLSGGGRRGGGAAGEAPARVVIDLGDSDDDGFQLPPPQGDARRADANPARAGHDPARVRRERGRRGPGRQPRRGWSALNEVERNLSILNFGGMLRFGHVLNRWITRPMVPFPQELTAR